jgi:putative membrane protein
MKGRPELPDEAPSTQEIVEKVSEISDILFRAPHAGYSYLVILGVPQVLLPLLWWRLDDVYWMAMVKSALIFSVPGVIAAAGGHRLARLLGGTFNRRRSGFLAASVTFFILVITLVGHLVHVFRPGFHWFNGLIGGIAYSVVIQAVVLFTTSDHRPFRTALVSLLQPVSALAIVGLLLPFGGRDWTIALTLLVVFLLTTLFFLDFVDAPVRRTTGVSFSLMFRYYIDHLSKGTLAAETLFDKTAGEIEALIAVASFRTPQGVKCGIVVPAVHPGPIGEIGGSNLPSKIVQTVGLTPNILVPHGAATHDFNPITTGEVERLGEAARRLFDTMPYSSRASPLVRAGEDAQVCAQFLGDGCLLTYTSWPRPIDDVDYPVGEAARMAAMAQGAHDAAFIDAHNSLELGSGAVWPSTRRALEIQHRSGEATNRADALRANGIRAGYAHTKDAFTSRQGIGEQGCQVIVTEVGGRKSAYILWDGNNMLPEVRGKIRAQIQGMVDEFEVLTTDNHSVNIVAGGYNPVGFRADVERISNVTKETLGRALADLEPVEVGLKTTRVPALRVFGHWNTIRFIAAVQTIVSTIPRAAALMLVMHALLATMVFLAGRIL